MLFLPLVASRAELGLRWRAAAPRDERFGDGASGSTPSSFLRDAVDARLNHGIPHIITHTKEAGGSVRAGDSVACWLWLPCRYLGSGGSTCIVPARGRSVAEWGRRTRLAGVVAISTRRRYAGLGAHRFGSMHAVCKVTVGHDRSIRVAMIRHYHAEVSMRGGALCIQGASTVTPAS